MAPEMPRPDGTKPPRAQPLKLLPMKVLLIERGEPFSFFRDPETEEGGAYAFMPFLDIESAAAFPEGGAADPALSCGYDVFVLPCEAFLGMYPADRPVPAIVYGSGEAAFACLEAGAADFMRSGWTLLELEARLFRLWQPRLECGASTIVLRGVTLSAKDFGAESPAKSCVLRPKEAAILRALLSASGKMVSSGSLCGRASLPGCPSRALGMQVARLRAKLAGVDPSLAECLKSVRGGGYSWSP